MCGEGREGVGVGERGALLVESEHASVTVQDRLECSLALQRSIREKDYHHQLDMNYWVIYVVGP